MRAQQSNVGSLQISLPLFADEKRRKKAEYDKLYRAKNRELKLARDKEYGSAHREKRLAYHREYYHKHKGNWNTIRRERLRTANYEKRQDWQTYQRGHYLRRKYDLLPGDFDRMVQIQNGECLICHEKPTGNLCVDHDHASGKVRGLLCKSCNSVLGQARDRVSVLRSAINYLEGYLEGNTKV